MINKDKIKGYIAGLTTAIIFCSTAVFAESIQKTITAVYNNIKIMIDGEEVIPKDANGNVVEPFIIDGTTYLPVRAVASALGQDVNWDGDTNTVYIGEMPESTSTFKLDMAALEQFSSLPLIMVGDTPVNGSFYNINMVQGCSSVYFPVMCDNFSYTENLQTITIDSLPAAKVLSDDLTNSFHTTVAIYNEAVKSGYTEKSNIKERLAASWEDYYSMFTDEADYNAFLKENAISDDDYKKLVKIDSVYSFYTDDLYSKYYSMEYSDKELADICKEQYVRAKHILVGDEQTALDIISQLKKGASFDTLMQEYNLDSGQGVDGYTFTTGEMVKEFETAAFALKENSYTATPVKTTYGYHIIYRYPIADDWSQQNAETIKTALASNKTNAAIEQIIAGSKLTYTENYNKYTSTIK